MIYNIICRCICIWSYLGLGRNIQYLPPIDLQQDQMTVAVVALLMFGEFWRTSPSHGGRSQNYPDIPVNSTGIPTVGSVLMCNLNDFPVCCRNAFSWTGPGPRLHALSLGGIWGSNMIKTYDQPTKLVRTYGECRGLSSGNQTWRCKIPELNGGF